MKNESYIKYILSDTFSLREYYHQRKVVTLQDVKRSTLLSARSVNHTIPDHYFRLGIEDSFKNINELSELFTIGLRNLSDEFLEIHDGRVFVTGYKMNEWQLLMPFIPPLLLVTVKIWEECGPDIEPCIDYIHNYILPSVKYTAIPSAYIPEMDSFRQVNGGFDDMHIHLNGSIETDLAWQDFMRFPERIYDEIKKSYRDNRDNRVKEHYEQLTGFSAPIDFYNLFCIAGKLREWLFNMIIYGHNIFDASSFEDLLTKLKGDTPCHKENPFTYLLGNQIYPLALESIFYIKILDYLANSPKHDSIAGAFHYYLLILGLSNRMLVQQTAAYGFEQFQKYTSNNFRDFSEKTYNRRFFQLTGNDMKNLRHIEGRFSPKYSLDDNSTILSSISDGFENLSKCQTNIGITPSTISLVAHFIKRGDSVNRDIRHEDLREELKKKTEALIALKNTNSKYAKMIVGVDAAASEFDTPPEVFAPSFHRLRECGFKHFTFHAGEDFFHILSGLRYIYEAIEFLELQAGDRIGHATAAGIDIGLWKANVGNKLWIRKEEYLDDLVFAYHLITISEETSLKHLLPVIALKAEKYSFEIYSDYYSIFELIQVWKKRKNDQESFFADAMPNSRIDQLFLNYHSKKVRENGKFVINVDAFDIFSEKELILLQQLVLVLMHRKQIAIETLPTSNVIIGQHHDFSTYHLYNWYKWSKEGIKVPAIVVGTDDAGVFSTNIYNEYCHIYCMLVFDKGLSPNEGMAYIKQLAENARVYAFR